MLRVTDVSLVIALKGGSKTSVQLSYEHKLILQLPPTLFHVESCLELTYTALSQFYIKLACVAFDGTYSERPLYSSRLPLGFTPHKLKLALPATASDYKKCLVAFEIKTRRTGVAAAMSNVAVLPSQCPPASKLSLIFSDNTL